MQPVEVLFKRIPDTIPIYYQRVEGCQDCGDTKDVKTPTRATDGRAYYDLYSNQTVRLGLGTIALVHTGLKLQAPQGYFIDVRPRSGLALKSGVTINNAPGTIDEDYGEEFLVILINHGTKIYDVVKGDRIAQFNVMPRYELDFIPRTITGTQGFGSTGK